MPKLKDTLESALGQAEPKKKAAAPQPEKTSPAKEHIAKILGNHKGLPTELVEKFYKCPNKMQVKKLLKEHLAQRGV